MPPPRSTSRPRHSVALPLAQPQHPAPVAARPEAVTGADRQAEKARAQPADHQAATHAAASAAPRYTISELALEFDITARAIRFYEDVGLLTPQRAGRNRVYTQRDRTRLKLTLRGKRLGLSLQEIKQLVDLYDSPSDTAQQLTAFLSVLAVHRQQLEQQREDLDITLLEIGQHESRCRELLKAQGLPAPRPVKSPRPGPKHRRI